MFSQPILISGGKRTILKYTNIRLEILMDSLNMLLTFIASSSFMVTFLNLGTSVQTLSPPTPPHHAMILFLPCNWDCHDERTAVGWRSFLLKPDQGTSIAV